MKIDFPHSLSFSYCTQGSYSVSPFVEEQKLIELAQAESRKVQFLMGREVAHSALSKFGFVDFPILHDEKRVPIWPNNIVGSITHTNQFAASMIGWEKDWLGIGIDAESIHRKIELKLQASICGVEEREWMSSFSEEEQKKYLRIIFSIKESIYKSIYPIGRVFFYFHDAQVFLTPQNQSFHFILLKDCGNIFSTGFQGTGKYYIQNEILLSALCLPRPV